MLERCDSKLKIQFSRYKDKFVVSRNDILQQRDNIVCECIEPLHIAACFAYNLVEYR